eukprot:CAMPEP_0197641310 /NCGR_PEP_ID=MMETSP1338-20131121/15311_1 /TAXON_ID=43686 ORGANISM="Pelagodinium beii, Strain RCC1491" /NCGR_SAMPLE_ID=MMETSP1338 /ASSEMBLY_ACC=CAM_ASM_000754 /LENGTH=227 /DNA_ID=CAMNT_0043214271 /DNA_START=17 /DNA_END=700 /DNA_ORIENTATION=-
MAPANPIMAPFFGDADKSSKIAQKSSSPLTIFDWDDTLLCSTFIESLGEGKYPEVPDMAKELLQHIEHQAYRLLWQAISLGDVCIVTNADALWIYNSAAKYLPGLLPLFNLVTIISARDLFEENYPGEPGRWKLLAFFNLTSQRDISLIDQFVVIGDATYEIDAARAVGEQFSAVQVKTVKLKENPTAVQVLYQLHELSDAFPGLVSMNAGVNCDLGRYLSEEAHLL